MHQLFVRVKEACDSVRMELFYNIPIECGVHMKILRLIEMSLNETYNNPGRNIFFWYYFNTCTLHHLLFCTIAKNHAIN